MNNCGAGNNMREVQDIESESILVIKEMERNPVTRTRYYFEVQRPDGEAIEFQISRSHNLGLDLINGHRYRLHDAELVKTNHKKYLRSTPETALEDITTSSPTELVITGDTHIGHKNLDPRYWEDQYTEGDCDRAFQKIIHYAIEEKVDGIIHTGDIYEGEVSEEKQEWVKQRIQKLSENDIGFAFIQGNHDPKYLLDEIEEIDRVMHIGDGIPRDWDGFRFLGYDYNTSSDPEGIEPNTGNETTLVFGHPDHPQVHAFNNLFDDKHLIFIGHKHDSRKNRHDAILVGSPATISSNPDPSIRRVQLLNGVIREEEITVDDLSG